MAALEGAVEGALVPLSHLLCPQCDSFGRKHIISTSSTPISNALQRCWDQASACCHITGAAGITPGSDGAELVTSLWERWALLLGPWWKRSQGHRAAPGGCTPAS